MELQPDQSSSISAADYRISIVGYLGENQSSRFGGLIIQNRGSWLDSKKSTAILTGRLADQAALFGVLNALISMCLPLLSVECIFIEESKGD